MKNIYAISALALILACAASIDLMAQKPNRSTFEIELVGKNYDSLSLAIYREFAAPIRMPSVLQDNKVWQFNLPDSLYETTSYMRLIMPNTDEKTSHFIQLDLLKAEGDTIKLGQFNLTPDQKYTANYYSTDSLINDPFFRKECVIFDKFLVSESKPTDFTLRATQLNIDKEDEMNYSLAFSEYLSHVINNPNSQYLLNELKEKFEDFEKEHASLAYSNFTETMRNSLNGKIIKNYLEATHFEDMQLTNPTNQQKEFIIQNSEKFNLVVFSASWCGPCHAQLPLLKELYAKQSEKLDIIYISIDEEATQKGWTDYMIKEQVPWRSLLAKDMTTEVRNRYYVKWIPYSILVYPNGEKQVVDIRKDADREILYNLENKM